MKTRNTRKRNRVTSRARLITLTTLGVAVAAFAPTALADTPHDANDPFLALETGHVAIGFRAKIAGLEVDAPTLVAPAPTRVHAHGPPAWALGPLPEDARDAAAAVTGASAARAGATPERALVLDDATLPLLPDASITLTVGTSSGHDGIARKIARTGHALTVTGLTVTFPDLTLASTSSAGGVRLTSDAARDPPAHDRLSYDPNARTHDALMPATMPAEHDASDAAPRTHGAGVTTASARAATSDPARALAQKAALAALAVSLPALIGWTLYHRMRGPGVLGNDTRKAIYDAITNEPGVGVQELSARMNISYSTTMYHLTRLQNAHMIVQSQDGNKLRYYKNGGAFNEQERHVLPLLKNPEVLRVLTIILEDPGTYRAEIASRMGVTATTVNWHLKRLVKHNLVLEQRQGRSAHLYVDQALLTKHLEPLVPKLKDADAELARTAERLVNTAHAHDAPAPHDATTPASA